MDPLPQTKIDELLSMAKRIKNPNARAVPKGQHEQTNYQVIGPDESFLFILYCRQNKNIRDDFSCGLSWNTPSGEVLTLVRYNGSSHPHINQLEKEKLDFVLPYSQSDSPLYGCRKEVRRVRRGHRQVLHNQWSA